MPFMTAATDGIKEEDKMIAIVKTCPLCGEYLVPFHKSEGNTMASWDVCVCGYESEKEIATITTTSMTELFVSYWGVDWSHVQT